MYFFNFQIFDEKISPLMIKLEKSQKYCEKLQSALDRRVHEVHTLRKESKQNCTRRAQLEKKLADLECMATEMNKQKAELIHYKDNAERKAAEMLISLNRENDTVINHSFLNFYNFNYYVYSMVFKTSRKHSSLRINILPMLIVII